MSQRKGSFQKLKNIQFVVTKDQEKHCILMFVDNKNQILRGFAFKWLKWLINCQIVLQLISWLIH